MAVTIQSRGDTAANWTSTNPILAEREIGIETDTGKWKFGDGATNWVSRAYASSGKRRVEVTINSGTLQAIPLTGMTFPILFWAAPQAGTTIRMTTTGGTGGDSEDFSATESGFITLVVGETPPTFANFQRLSGSGSAICGVEG